MDALSLEQKKNLVVSMTGLGCTVEECATVVGCTDRTIRNWRKDDAEFTAKMDGARLQVQLKLKQTAYRLATGETPDKTMLIFLLKTMCGLNEKVGLFDQTIIVENSIQRDGYPDQNRLHTDKTSGNCSQVKG